MIRLFFRDSLVLIAFSLFLSCSTKETEVERAFYYWKNSEYSLDTAELSCLRDLRIRKLYVKFFEVDYDTLLGAVLA